MNLNCLSTFRDRMKYSLDLSSKLQKGSHAAQSLMDEWRKGDRFHQYWYLKTLAIAGPVGSAKDFLTSNSKQSEHNQYEIFGIIRETFVRYLVISIMILASACGINEDPEIIPSVTICELPYAQPGGPTQTLELYVFIECSSLRTL